MMIAVGASNASSLCILNELFHSITRIECKHHAGMAVGQRLVLFAKKPLWLERIYRDSQSKILSVLGTVLVKACIQPSYWGAWVSQARLRQCMVQAMKFENYLVPNIGIEAIG